MLPLGKGVRVLGTHPAGLLALEKPEGVLSHPNGREVSSRALLKACYDEDREAYVLEGGGLAYLLHRLDSPTSGVLLVALEEALAEAVRAAFRGQRVHKTYVAVVGGHRRQGQGLWRDALDKRKQGGQLRAESGRGHEAVSAFRFLKQGRRLHLLELKPQTGRTHQLRAQCALHGYPIVGDKTYGDFKLNQQVRQTSAHKRLFLHAREVSLKLDYKGRALSFRAHSPLPLEFETLLKGA